MAKFSTNGLRAKIRSLSKASPQFEEKFNDVETVIRLCQKRLRKLGVASALFVGFAPEEEWDDSVKGIFYFTFITKEGPSEGFLNCDIKPVDRQLFRITETIMEIYQHKIYAACHVLPLTSFQEKDLADLYRLTVPQDTELIWSAAA